MSSVVNFQCETCQKYFKSKSGYSTHIKSCNVEKTFLCEFCNKNFSTKKILNNHFQACKDKKSVDENLRLNQLLKDQEEKYLDMLKVQEEKLEKRHFNDIEKLKIIYEASFPCESKV